LEQDKNKGNIEKEINLSLQKLKGQNALSLQNDQQDFLAPERNATIANINAESKQKRFDTRLGMDYSAGFLENKMYTDKLYRQYLEKELGLGSSNTQIPEPIQDTSTPSFMLGVKPQSTPSTPSFGLPSIPLRRKPKEIIPWYSGIDRSYHFGDL